MKSLSILDTRDKEELQEALNEKADKTEIPTTPAEVDADPAGTANLYVTRHDKNADSHIDMREQINELSNKVDNSISEIERAVGGLGYMKIGEYTVVPNIDGHLSVVYTG